MKTDSAILTYHSLDDSGSAISAHPDVFREQLECFLDLQIPIVALSDVQRVPGSVALTFDDGYRNFLEFGYPILAKYRLPATVFVVSGYCGPSAKYLPGFLSLSELRTLATSGIEIGAHTVSHPDLTALSQRDAEREVGESRLRLEDWLGRTVENFAYPYGRCNPVVQRLVGQHFRRACGASLGFVSGKSDLFHLPRLDMYYLRRRHWYSRLMKRDGRAYIALRRLLREARGWVRRGALPTPAMALADRDAERSRP